jgi:cytochrome c
MPGDAMKNLVYGAAVACIAVLAAAPARAQNVDELLKKNACLACHAVDKKLVGPAYKEVAAKYRGQKDAEKLVAERVKKGSTGVWGQIPMPPNAAVPDAEINTMVKWILSQK